MTTAEAWRQLAEWCNDLQPCKCDRACGRMLLGGVGTGLCACLAIMVHRKMISQEQETAMLAELPNRGPIFVKGVRPWQWPTTVEGAHERARFCWAKVEKHSS